MLPHGSISVNWTSSGDKMTEIAIETALDNHVQSRSTHSLDGLNIMFLVLLKTCLV